MASDFAANRFPSLLHGSRFLYASNQLHSAQLVPVLESKQRGLSSRSSGANIYLHVYVFAKAFVFLSVVYGGDENGVEE